jgi:multidrug efflux pump subunit AcrA (membrane-fusion protein)
MTGIHRSSPQWLNYLLGLLCVGAIATAILVVGPASGSQTSQSRTATVARGVVQSTVSGSGNLQAASQLNLGFKTSGTVTHIYVTQGKQVAQGQLLATLDPQSAEVTLEQARASLQAAEASLAQEEENNGETSAGQSSGGSGTSRAGAGAGAGSTTTSTTTSAAAKPTISTATREANLSSARGAVKSDELTVRGDEEAVQDTKLYAPEDGTIASLSGLLGEVVSASGTTRASSSSSSSSSSGSGASAAGGASSSGRSAAGSSSSSGSSGSSSSPFAILSDLSRMRLVVALSESEIGSVRVGQIATVTVEALEGRKLAAHVSEVAILSTSASGVVSYDVTFQLDQMESGLKPGMSATAEVVVKQAEGVNVPTSAISAGSVTVVRSGKDVPQRVVTGLAGNSSTIVLSGLKAGETVVLPEASSTSSSTSSLTSRLSGRGGGGALGGGRGGFAGGGAAFFRGGG